MSSVTLAADTTAIEDHCPRTVAHSAKEAASLLEVAQGVAAGLFFLAARVPVYVGILLFGALVSLAGVALYSIRAIGLRLSRPAGAAAAAAAALALVCVASPQRARADTITDSSLLQQTSLVFSRQTNLYSFDAPGAGTLSITLKDWNFPTPLEQLTASILSQDQVLGPSFDSSKDSDWSFEVPIRTGGLFDAFVAAQAGTLVPGVQIGAYSMSITFAPAATPVPLPPAVDLLLGGIGLLGAVTLLERLSRRRNRDVISIA